MLLLVIIFISFLCPSVLAQESQDSSGALFLNYFDVLINFMVPFLIYLIVDYDSDENGSNKLAIFIKSLVFLFNVGIQEELAFLTSPMKIPDYIKILQHIVISLIGLKVIGNFINYIRSGPNEENEPTSKFEKFEKKVENKFIKLENKLEKRVKTKFDEAEKGVNDKFDKLEKEVNNKFDVLEKDVTTKFDVLKGEVYTKFDGLKKEVNGNVNGFKKEINAKFVELKDGVSTKLDKLNGRVQKLEEKMEIKPEDFESELELGPEPEPEPGSGSGSGSGPGPGPGPGPEPEPEMEKPEQETKKPKQELKTSEQEMGEEMKEEPFENVDTTEPTNSSRTIKKLDIYQLLLSCVEYIALILFVIVLGFLFNELKGNITRNFIITLVIPGTLTFVIQLTILIVSYRRENLQSYIESYQESHKLIHKHYAYIDVSLEFFIYVTVLYLPSLINCFLLQTPDLFNKIFLNLSGLVVTAWITLMYKAIKREGEINKDKKEEEDNEREKKAKDEREKNEGDEKDSDIANIA